MPLPALLPAIISGSSQIAGGVINGLQQGRQNRLSREWSEGMYDRQYQDNLAFWNLQNQYNDPASQMDRLRSAGLNPALMYGGSGGGGVAAGSPQSPNPQRPEFKSSSMGNNVSASGLATISALYDLEMKQAQVDNLRADKTIKFEQAALLASQGDMAKFQYGLESSLGAISAEARREDLRKRVQDREFGANQEARNAIMHSSNMSEAAERMLSMQIGRSKSDQEITNLKAQLSGIRSDGIIKEIDANLYKNTSINPRDPFWARILGHWLENYLSGDKTGGLDLNAFIFGK